MNFYTDLFWGSDFGRVFCRCKSCKFKSKFSANVRAADNIFFGVQTIKGCLLIFYVDLFLLVDISAFLKTYSVQVWTRFSKINALQNSQYKFSEGNEVKAAFRVKRRTQAERSWYSTVIRPGNMFPNPRELSEACLEPSRSSVMELFFEKITERFEIYINRFKHLQFWSMRFKDYLVVLIQHWECELYFLCFAGHVVLYLICTICIFQWLYWVYLD